MPLAVIEPQVPRIHQMKRYSKKGKDVIFHALNNRSEGRAGP